MRVRLSRIMPAYCHLIVVGFCMFYALFGLSLLIATAVAVASAKFFDPAVGKILTRTMGQELSDAWRKYVMFAIVVSGVSGGVRPWALEQYLPSGGSKGNSTLQLTGERWTLELYSTFIDTLRSIAWVMLLFFLFAMVAYLVKRAVDVRRGEAAKRSTE